jgi:hypothetical protein
MNRNLKKIKRTVSIIGECGFICHYLLLTKYHSGDEVKKTEMGRTCGTYGERRDVYRALVGKPEGRRPLGRPRRRWEDNIKMDL